VRAERQAEQQEERLELRRQKVVGEQEPQALKATKVQQQAQAFVLAITG
jgi:hypothetical protein